MIDHPKAIRPEAEAIRRLGDALEALREAAMWTPNGLCSDCCANAIEDIREALTHAVDPR